MRKYVILWMLLCNAGIAFGQSLPDAPTPKVQTDAEVQDKGPAHSNPYQIQDPYWKDHKVVTKRYWSWVGAMVGSSYASYAGGKECREGGVEGCTANYGAFYATEISQAVIIDGAGAIVYHLCRKDTHDSKWCDLIPGMVVAGNSGWGIHEAFFLKHHEPR